MVHLGVVNEFCCDGFAVVVGDGCFESFDEVLHVLDNLRNPSRERSQRFVSALEQDITVTGQVMREASSLVVTLNQTSSLAEIQGAEIALGRLLERAERLARIAYGSEAGPWSCRSDSSGSSGYTDYSSFRDESDSDQSPSPVTRGVVSHMQQRRERDSCLLLL